MILGSVVQHIVKINLDPLGVCRVQKGFEIGFGAVVRIDAGIVQNVIAVIG